MCVDAQWCLHVLRSAQKALPNVGGQRATVSVAQHNHIGARFFRGLQRGQRMFGIGLKPIEEMLGVVNHFLPARFQKGHRLTHPMFSSSEIPRAVLTCRSQLLPKMVTTGVLASTSAFRFGSFSAW